MADLASVPWYGAVLGWFSLSAYLAIYFALFSLVVSKWLNPWKVSTKKQKPSNRIAAKIAEKQQDSKQQKFAQSLKESLHSLRFAMMHGSLWALLEWLRSWLFTGFSWNGLGTAFHDTPVFAQSAELVGVVALSFFPMFVCSVLFQVAVRMFKEAQEGSMKPHWDLIVAGLVVALMFGFGTARMQQLNREAIKKIDVLLVQQNLKLDTKWDESANVGTMMNYVQMSQDAVQNLQQSNAQRWNAQQKKQSDLSKQSEPFKLKKIDMIFWPESTLIHGLRRFKKEKSWGLVELERVAIEQSLEKGNHYLISGCNEYHFESIEALEEGKRPEFYNSIAIFKKGTQEGNYLIDSYRKNHLVLFGEYIPFRDTLPFLESLMGGASGANIGPNYLSGNSTEPLKINLGGEQVQLIPSVCFEDTVGELTRKSIRPELQMIINVTNDGWFGKSEAPKQHAANAAFRCIELRRPMVRSANTGVSCIINVKGSMNNADGSINAILDDKGTPFLEDTLHGQVEILKNAPITLYAMAGNWFIGVCALFFLSGFTLFRMR